MKLQSVVVALGMSLWGCGPGASPPLDAGADSGASDGGLAELDAGLSDASTVADAGVCVVNASTFGLEPLPASCLPRCAAATRTAALACADSACRAAALTADTTPSGNLYVMDDPRPIELTCRSCSGLRLFYCASVHGCSPEVMAVIACTSGTCTTEVDALNACVATNPDPVHACIYDEPGGCFADR